MNKWLQIKNRVVNEDGADKKTSEIIIYGEIGDWWEGLDAATLAQAIREVETDYIDIRMLTYGGSAITGLGVYNVLKASGKEIRVYNDGIIASAGTLIASAGKVYMPNNALYMLHSALVGTYGNAKDLRETADMLDKFDDGIKSIYKLKTGLDDEKINELMSKDTWLSATEAKELGFIDVVTDSIEIAAKAAPHGTVLNNIAFPSLSSKNVPQSILNHVKSGNTTTKGGEKMDLNTLKNNHADIYAQAKADGASEANAKTDEAVKAERQRIQDIQDMALMGQEDLVKAAITDGLSAGEFAISAMKATKDKAATHIENRNNETKQLANVDNSTVTTPVDAKAEALDKAFLEG